MITDNLADFEEFGQLRFETESVRNSKNRTNEEKTYFLNENHTYSLSHLLKKFEVGISAKKLNLILLKEGYLEIKTRKSSGSVVDEKTKEKKPKMKEFKSLTEKGLKFGKNVISPHNQLETQPHYYEKSFMELIESLKI